MCAVCDDNTSVVRLVIFCKTATETLKTLYKVATLLGVTFQKKGVITVRSYEIVYYTRGLSRGLSCEVVKIVKHQNDTTLPLLEGVVL